MISEYFVEQSLDICCSLPPNNPLNREIFSAIHQIINWYKKNNNFKDNDLTLEFKEKLELLDVFSIYRFKEGSKFSFNEFISRLETGKYKNLVPILKLKYRDITDDEFSRFSNSVMSHFKLCEIVNDKQDFENLLNDLNNSNYIDSDDIVHKWEKKFHEWHSKFLALKKIEIVSGANSLNLLNDDFKGVVDRFRESYSPENILKTGYDDIDSSLPLKGLEKRRIYIFVGETGIGKSMFMTNVICNSMLSSVKDGEKRKTYLYFTAENLIDETLVRFYCCLTGKSVDEVVNNMLNDSNYHNVMKNEFVEIFNRTGCNLVLQYFPSGKATMLDLENIIIDVKEKSDLKAVVVDYLDLFKSGNNNPELRHELTDVTVSLKNLGITYDFVMLTATQMNKSGYNGANSSNTVIKESMGKAETSDGIILLQSPNEENKRIIIFITPEGEVEAKIIDLTISKSRNGEVMKKSKFMVIQKINGKNVFNHRIIPFVAPVDEDGVVQDDYDNPMNYNTFETF